jgi:hypothetical protein
MLRGGRGGVERVALCCGDVARLDEHDYDGFRGC